VVETKLAEACATTGVHVRTERLDQVVTSPDGGWGEFTSCQHDERVEYDLVQPGGVL
jgi:hypothetical protein